MRKIQMFVLALAGFVAHSNAGGFADAVVSYSPGQGYASRFTNTTSVLGEPSQVNPFGDLTDPFNPAYGTDQILSIGAGGSLTVKFSTPVLNHPRNRFGVDFIIFGNSGFIITNDFSLETFDWIGTPATDGSLFANNTGVTRVSVSRDGVTFYTLNPALAPTVDNLFPTDGNGDFSTPVDPTLTPADLAGLDLDQIRALYYGSAGGAGYDIAWAQDADGKPVKLAEISYVRVEVLSGKSEVDGFASVFTPPGHSR